MNNINIIRNADSAVSKIIGEQKGSPEAAHFSQFVIRYGDLYYNALTGELIKVSGDCGEYLFKKWYLIKNGTDEMKLCLSLRTVLRQLTFSSRRCSYTVLPTSECNARCPYCYEAGMKHCTMTDETADRLVSRIVGSGDKKVSITWFGGEPLVGIRQIDRIAQALQDHGIELRSSIISNGYLFSEAVVKRAVSLWHLASAQITLDGTEEIYNKTKNYLNPSVNPYQKVLDNIDLLLDNGIKVDVRMNVGKHNIDDLYKLIEELKRFKGKNISPYFHAIFDECSEEMDRVCAQLEDRLVEVGLRKPGTILDGLSANHCMADSPKAFVINPEGWISKCEHHVFDRIVGELGSELDKTKMAEWEKYTIYKQCESCPLVPRCIRLSNCPTSTPCSDFQKNRSIEKVRITMRLTAENKESTQDAPSQC